jgi:aspartate 1-decarboxylase
MTVLKTMLFAKIHRATVTRADLTYEGSLSIDQHLLDLSGILPFQQIAVFNVNNGQRFETYAIVAPAHSGTIQVNGAAARLAQSGDILIIASYAQMDAEHADGWTPTVVHVDAHNRPKQPALMA